MKWSDFKKIVNTINLQDNDEIHSIKIEPLEFNITRHIPINEPSPTIKLKSTITLDGISFEQACKDLL